MVEVGHTYTLAPRPAGAETEETARTRNHGCEFPFIFRHIVYGASAAPVTDKGERERSNER